MCGWNGQLPIIPSFGGQKSSLSDAMKRVLKVSGIHFRIGWLVRATVRRILNNRVLNLNYEYAITTNHSSL